VLVNGIQIIITNHIGFKMI